MYIRCDVPLPISSNVKKKIMKMKPDRKQINSTEAHCLSGDWKKKTERKKAFEWFPK